MQLALTWIKNKFSLSSKALVMANHQAVKRMKEIEKIVKSERSGLVGLIQMELDLKKSLCEIGGVAGVDADAKRALHSSCATKLRDVRVQLNLVRHKWGALAREAASLHASLRSKLVGFDDAPAAYCRRMGTAVVAYLNAARAEIASFMTQSALIFDGHSARSATSAVLPVGAQV